MATNITMDCTASVQIEARIAAGERVKQYDYRADECPAIEFPIKQYMQRLAAGAELGGGIGAEKEQGNEADEKAQRREIGIVLMAEQAAEGMHAMTLGHFPNWQARHSAESLFELAQHAGGSG